MVDESIVSGFDLLVQSLVLVDVGQEHLEELVEEGLVIDLLLRILVEIGIHDVLIVASLSRIVPAHLLGPASVYAECRIQGHAVEASFVPVVLG